MIAAIAAAPLPATRGFLTELLDRQRTLATFGLTLLLLGLVTAIVQTIDPRTLASGVSIWVKPTKFFFSAGLFALTSAWFFGYVRPERRAAPMLKATVAALLLAAGFELVWISWQALNGADSHFNLSTPFTSLMFSLMGAFAVILTATALPLAWEIARRPAAGLSRDFTAAVAIGLVLTFLVGTISGGYMGFIGSHAVGTEGGNLPIFGWNRMGGDIRISHFLGIHAQQAIPLIAVAAAGLAAPARWAALIAGTAAYLFLTTTLFLQAAAGQPLLPL